MNTMLYREWKEYFLQNQSHFSTLDWEAEDVLTDSEKKAITRSIQQFQRGEYSEGKHLYAFAKKFPDPQYLEAIRLFIREEQDHALVLGKFMDKHQLPRIQNHWVDAVFRFLRAAAGLENTLLVLVTAEIVAKVYYAALENATQSQLLRQLCRQLLKDEDQHLAFQAVTLNRLYQQSSGIRRILMRSWHRLLMTGTLLLVGWVHRRVLNRGGYRYRHFLSAGMKVYDSVEQQIKQPLLRQGVARQG